jgi:hypothetical protein
MVYLLDSNIEFFLSQVKSSQVKVPPLILKIQKFLRLILRQQRKISKNQSG